MKRLLNVINALPEAVILVHGHGTVVALNLAARELFGDDLKEGDSLFTIFSNSSEEVRRSLSLWSSTGHFLPASLQLGRDGQSVTLRCDGAAVEPVTRESPSLLMVRCVPRDESATAKCFIQLNERIERLWKLMAEQKARDADRLNSLATAAAVFAHEVANPLNGIGMSVQLLEQEFLERQDASPLLRESILEANKEISRLSSLLRDFRNFARTHQFKFKPTDLAKLIHEVLSPEMVLFSTFRVRVVSELQGLPPVSIDPDKMKQAILNLCKNAVEAMPEGGCLTIKGYLPNDGMLALEISDTGVGIPEGVDVFELFRTTKPDGTGLGLPLVSQIISGHKGTVEYSSEPGKGTTFKIYLPITSV